MTPDTARSAPPWAQGVCVITGAGSGFGRALALELGRRGAELLLSDIDLPSVLESAQLALAQGARAARTQRCDVQQLADIEALAAACTGRIGLVVNNAGVGAGGRIGELPIADWRRTLEINLFGVIYGCHVFVPLLRKQGSGHVLNVASAAGLVSATDMGAYNVSKAGVVSLSETLAAELLGSGVSVTALCPTFFQTNIVSSGRFTDEQSRRIADFLMARAKPVEGVVHGALRAVERRELFCLPMADARWAWRVKRALPEQFYKLAVRHKERVLAKLAQKDAHRQQAGASDQAGQGGR